jgi:hypothetical protein
LAATASIFFLSGKKARKARKARQARSPRKEIWQITIDGRLNLVDFFSVAYEVNGNALLREISRVNNPPVSDNKFKHTMEFSLESLRTYYIKTFSKPFDLPRNPFNYGFI